MAAADYTSLVQSIYISYFGRPADTFGLANFSAQLNTLNAPTTVNGLTAAYSTNAGLKSLIDSFGSSAESTALYGTDTVAFVSAIYANVLNRAADFDGLVFWVNAINSGSLTKGNASLAIMAGAINNTSAQGVIDAQVLANKVQIATNFTVAIDTGAELSAYNGNAAAAVARDMLKTVTATTVPATFQATVDATLKGLVDGMNVGQVFATTSGVDAIVGTSNNDVINVIAVKADGTDGTTLISSDSIDGGAGVDTVNITVNGSFNSAIAGTFKNVEIINIDNTAATAAANVSASVFGASATTIKQIGKAGNVSGLAATTTAVFKSLDLSANVHAGSAGTLANNTTNPVVPAVVGTTGSSETVSAASTAASIHVTLDGVKGDAATATAVAPATDGSAAGTLATVTNQAVLKVSGGSLNSVTIDGTMSTKTAGGAANSLALTVTEGTDADGKGLSTLAVSSNQATILTVANSGTGNGVTTVDASASTGAITFDATALTSVSTIKTGAGKDTVTIHTATAIDDLNTTTNETVNASVSTGAGDDKITITTTGSGVAAIDSGDGNDSVIVSTMNTGGLTINLGAGNDKVDISAVTLTTKDMMNGGDGVDTLIVAGKAAFAAGDYLLVDATTTGFETLNFKAGTDVGSTTALDASQLIKFSTLSFGSSGIVTKVADAQALVLSSNSGATDNLTATHKDYVADSGSGATYAGTLNVTSSEDAATLTLNAGTANVSIKTSGTTPADVANTIKGDMAAVNVTLASTSTVDASSGVATGAESLAKVTIAVDDATNGPVFTGLTSIVVKGAGVATIDLSDVGTLGDVGSVKTVDVSGMTALANLNVNGDQVIGTTVGAVDFGYLNLSTTSITGNDNVAETFLLGGAKDAIVTNSSYAKMDTITGFTLTASATDATVLSAAKSDSINVAGTQAFHAITVTSTTLSGALLEASTAASASGTAYDAVAFTVGGDTYLYVDTGTHNVFDATDVVVKLTGVLDLNLLIQAVA